MTAPETVFFLSDYGLRDTFVGVVHAVLRRLAPTVPVVDLTHEVEPFDVRGGSIALAHAVPYLGPGVVLAVVDPGVGGARRAVAVRVASASASASAHGPQWLVGPDNGLLVPAIDMLGGVAQAAVWELPGPGPATSGARTEPGEEHSVTFDGRDVFAPAVGALCRGLGEPDRVWGDPVDPHGLAQLPPPVVEHDSHEGRLTLRAEVTAVDRFGNVQLAARRADLPPGLPAPDEDGALHLTLSVLPRFAHPERDDETRHARWVSTFADLERAELGLLVDSAGCLALVMPEASAAAALCIAAGDLVALAI